VAGLPAIHVNTMLLILIGALCADARFQASCGTRTKIQERRRAAQSASRSTRGGGCDRRSQSRLNRRRRMQRPR